MRCSRPRWLHSLYRPADESAPGASSITSSTSHRLLCPHRPGGRRGAGGAGAVPFAGSAEGGDFVGRRAGVDAPVPRNSSQETPRASTSLNSTSHSGSRRPCSYPRIVQTGTPLRSASWVWLKPAFSRKDCSFSANVIGTSSLRVAGHLHHRPSVASSLPSPTFENL